MIDSLPRVLLAAGLVLAGTAIAANADSGTFVVVGDIHFDPFDPPDLARAIAAAGPTDRPIDWRSYFAAEPAQAFSIYGKDTNHALLTATLAALATNAAVADFAIVPGDLISHNFEDDAASVLSAPPGSEAVAAFAARTTDLVAQALADTLPGKPIIVSLGNNDSACGDYRITPGGGYLAATREIVRRLAGPDRVAADFDQTYAAGGYYAMRHPILDDTLVLVVNDILWSAKYRNACGDTGNAAADAMMSWLSDILARQKIVGGNVWLVHHIPWGIDAYSTVNAKASTCAKKVVPFLREPYASGFLDLIGAYADIITTSLSGHIHHDTYRLLSDHDGRPLEIDKVAIAISPIYQQNPGFHIFTYDRGTGIPNDFSTVYLTNLETASTSVAGDWRVEYTFSHAYRQAGYSVAAIAAIWRDLSKAGSLSEAFRQFYGVRHDTIDAAALPAYACAIGELDPASFAACYCGD